MLLFQQGVPADSIHRAVSDVFTRPEYEWVQTVQRHWLRDLWWGLRDWLARLSADHPTAARLLFWGALLALIGLLTHLGLTVWRIYRATVAKPAASAPGLAPTLHDAKSLLTRAETLARQGRYTEALAYRFVALVLDLDRQKLVTFHPSKTPAEYVREARLGESGRATLAGLVSRLYHHVFGAEPLDEQGYREFSAAVGTLQQHVVSH